jgi:hypothetical protein
MRGRRRTVTAALSGVALAAGLTIPLAFAGSAAAGTADCTSPSATLTSCAQFESNDADLSPEAPVNFDWNSFAPVTWNRSNDPYDTAAGTTSNVLSDGFSQNWTFAGLTDAMASTTDTGFAGGTKQDNNCPAVIGSKAPNKDDLQSAYFGTSVADNGHIMLELAWERIPQNTTNASAHVAFEFNQGTSGPCPATSDSLVSRTPGDMLLVFDFGGGSTATPTLALSRWLAAGSTSPCQVGSDSPPCWSVQTTLAEPVAEAAVNTGANGFPSTVFDNVAEGSILTPTGTPLKLLTSQFGEAGVDLTAAGVFGNTCTTFGKAWAVSRSSGNSSTAAMEDLVGPGSFNVSNCATKITTQPQSSTDGTSFTNLANGASIPAGTFVRDLATVTVTGVNSWSGNVDFFLCSSTTSMLTSCDPAGTNATQIGGDVPVSNTSTTATSASQQVTTAGSYCWAAKFTGTSPANLPGALSTTGECFTVTAPTSIATNPWFYPQDRAVISAPSGGNLAGSVSFTLYDNVTDCNAQGTTGVLFQETDNVAATSPHTVDTSNATFRVHSSTTLSSLFWLVTYTSTNANQTSSSSVCVENIGATITPDGTVTFP